MDKIKSVCIICRGRAKDEDDIIYFVGYNGVTEIKKSQRAGNMSYVDVYNIYKGKFLLATVERPDEIIYQEE